MRVVVLRRMLIVAVVIAALSVAAWFVGLPRYRPEISASQMFGVDVSNHQGEIDWSLVPSSNVEFAYIKATEGSDWVDSYFAANWSAAQTAGLRTGAYHFFSHCTSGVEQAAHFLTIAPPDPLSLPPAVDIELSGACLDAADPDRVLREVQTFLETVEQAHGRSVLLYVLDGFEYLEPVTTERPAWRRSLFRGPVESDWALWQFHNRARVAGIDGPVDLNIANTDLLQN